MRLSQSFIQSIIVFCACVACSIPSYTQTEFKKPDLELTGEFRKMTGQAFGDNYDLFDSLIHSFKDRIKKDLATPSSFTNPYDSLSSEILILQSDDHLLRIFSWDELSGGTWHDMAAFAQFKTASGSIGVQQLDTDREMEMSTYTDVLIREIHQVTIKNKTHYLLIGDGTHGAGHHHTTAQIFSIERDKLVKCKDCFESGEELVVESARIYKTGLKYDPASGKLSYTEFKEDEGGFKSPTGKVITLKLTDNTLKR
jgi:hypothetical protein